MARALFQNIYRDIQSGIERGLYSYQSMLLSESELCARYGCSRSTVRRALSELALNGYVQPIQGKGVRIIWRPQTDDRGAPDNLESFAERARHQGFASTVYVRSFERITVDERLSQATGFSPGTPIFVINRVKSADGIPVSIETSHLLATEAPALTPRDVEGSLYAYLESQGVAITTGKRTITIEAPNDDDQMIFGIDGPQAVGVIRGHFFDSQGIMFEYSEIRQKPDFFTIHETCTRTMMPHGTAPVSSRH
ncbi:MAG: GntR family transcriptional regulator [Olsenella profusa]